MDRIVDMERIKVASLFSGCGGMDLGIMGGFSYLSKPYPKNPFQIIYAIDNDSYSSAIYNENFSHNCIVKDIKKIDPSEVPDHELLIAGFPCKSFSIIAQNPPRLGYDDENGKLFLEIVKILDIKRPRFFITENVKGLLSANEGKAFSLIIKKFQETGYHTKFNLLKAIDYGVPQKRERIFIVGFRDFSDYIYFNFPSVEIVNCEKAVLGDVIDLEMPVDQKYFFSDRAVEGMLRNRKKMNKGRAMDLTQPCNTISSHLAKVSLNGTDPVLYYNGQYRRFTPREAADIQSFPKSFKLNVVSEFRQYVAIGNAVPPVMMWYLANSLIQLVKMQVKNSAISKSL